MWVNLQCLHWQYPLIYILTMGKLDAGSHHWVASLANYNFQLYYWARKTSIDADTLLRVSWPGCMPDKSGMHLQVTAAAVWVVQDAALKGLTNPIEVYSCNLHVLDSVQDSQQVTCMTLEDWHQAQQADPTLSLVISRLWDGFNQFLGEWNHLLLKKGCPIQNSQTQGVRGDPLSAGFASCT